MEERKEGRENLQVSLIGWNSLLALDLAFLGWDLPGGVVEVKSQESGQGVLWLALKCLPGSHHGNPFDQGLGR